MGNQQGTTKCLEQHYAHLLGKHMKFAASDIKVGGMGESVVGGYSALEDYGNSVYSKAKEELIRGIAADVSNALQVKGDYARTAPIKDLIEKFKRIVPDPRNKKTIAADVSAHKSICTSLANAINKRYDMNIINVHAEPGVMCQKVSEIMYSLFTGIHTEFLTVSGDVKRIVNNLHILKKYVDSANNKLMKDLESSTDMAISSEAENIKKLYDALSSEIDRQLTILVNITDSVIEPLGKSLITLLADNNDFIGLTDKLKDMVGTPAFGEKLSYLLNGTSDIAHAAHLVDKALKEVGLTVKDYKDSRTLSELRDKTYQTIIKKQPSAGELRKMLVAADILYRNDLAHDDIASYLEKKKGGYNIGEVDFASMVDDATWQDNTNSPFDGRTQSYRKSVGKQIHEQEKYRNMVFSDFNKQLKDKYQSIVYVLEKLSGKVGTEIQPSPELERFIRLIHGFGEIQPNRKDLHKALSGYKTDALSNFTKFQYLDYLDHLLNEAKALSSGKGGELFATLAKCFSDLISTVDDFNKNFVNAISESHVTIEQPRARLPMTGGNSWEDGMEYGGSKKHKKHDQKIRENNLDGEEHHEEKDLNEFGLNDESEKSDMVEEVEEVAEEVSTSEEAEAEPEIVGGRMSKKDVEVLGGIISNYSEADFKHFVTLKRAVQKLDYYYKIAGIKSSLNKTAIENAANAANYENILGEEAGHLIDEIQKRFNALMSSANGQPLPRESYVDQKTLYLNGVLGVNNIGGMTNETLKDDCKTSGLNNELEGYKFLLEYIRGSKIEMLEAAQALDLYLSKFTQNIENKPDLIQNFAQVVEQLEIVAKWFTDKSGDNYKTVFEMFGNVPRVIDDIHHEGAGAIGAAGANMRGDIARNFGMPGDAQRENKEHYYEVLAVTDPGLFYHPRLMTREHAIEFVRNLEKSIKSVRALENIISIFSKVGTHSQDNNKTFMSTAAIFKAFMKYCVASVISVGYSLHPQTAGNDNVGDSKIDFKNGGGGNDINLNAASRPFIKMATGLRFSKNKVRINANLFIKLCDPLETPSENKNDESVCDKIFEMCVKSMVAKIFTVVGSYALFNKPPRTITNSDAMATSALRQILGGSSGGASYAKVLPEAAELYLRLPLLAEWYRTVFEFKSVPMDGVNGEYVDDNNLTHQKDPIVSIVPEMDNIWRDLCNVIFIKGRNIQDGSYPAEYAKTIIETTTEIYKSYAGKKRDIKCREILEEFILEINRRYGFMLRSEINKYIESREKDFSPDTYDTNEDVDFDLLGANDVLGRAPAPSDRFRSFGNNSRPARQYELNQFYVAVRRFRHSIEKNLILDVSSGPTTEVGLNDLSATSDVSLNEIVQLTRKKLEKAQTDEDKYRIIYEQLHGIEKYGDVDQNKLLAFHETVLTPLTVLYFTYTIINDYNRFMISMDLREWANVVEQYITGVIITNRTPNAVAGVNQDAKFARPDGAGALVGNEAGNLSTILAMELLYRNNKRYKKSTAFAHAENNLTVNREGIFNVDEVKNYIRDSFVAAGVVELGPIFNGYLFTPAPGGAALNINTILDTKHPGVGANTNSFGERVGLIRRLFLNRERLMEDLLRNVMNISCELNGLVDVSFSGQGQLRYPIVNFDKLEEVCAGLFQSVKSSLSGLRKYVPYSVINSIEKINRDGNERNVISLFWLQDNLFERLFKNKYGNGLSDASQSLKNIWGELTRKHEFNHIERGAGTPARALLVLGEDKRTNTSPLHAIREAGAAAFGNYNQAANQIRTRNVAGLANNDHAPGVILGNATTQQTKDILEQYQYDSYGEVVSKLAFWDVTNPENSVLHELGLRSLSMTNEINEFPAHYLPIYVSGGSVAVPKTKDEREILANYITQTDFYPLAADSARLRNYNNKIVQPFLRNQGVATNNPVDGTGIVFDIMLGCHNLYDYNVKYGNHVELADSTNLDVQSRNFGGRDKIAPHNAAIDQSDIKNEYKSLNRKLGLLPILNNIIYNYITCIQDSTTKKIYRPLLEKFVNGYNSKDILQGKNINDRVICRSDFTRMTEMVYSRSFFPSAINATGAGIGGAGAAAANQGSPFLGLGAGDAQTDLAQIRSAVCQLEPPEQAVLFASLANGIKGIMSLAIERTSGSTFKFIEDNFANINEYQKEIMRAYFPGFEKQLEILTKRAEFLKLVIENTSCKVYKWKQHNTAQAAAGGGAGSLFSSATGAPFVKTVADVSIEAVAGLTGAALRDNRLYFQTAQENDLSYTQPLRAPVVENESARKTYLINMLTDITSTAKSLSKIIQAAYKELADIPLFFETYKGSILDYNNRNGHLPLMPLSTVTNLMNMNLHRYNIETGLLDDREDVNDEKVTQYSMILLPGNQNGVGSTSFKFAYGTRGLLYHEQKPSAEYAPGITALLEYGKLGGDSTGFDKVSVNSMISNTISLMRFVTDYQYHIQYLDAHRYDYTRRLLNRTQISDGGTPAAPNIITGMTCQTAKGSHDNAFWKRTENSVLLAENDNRKQAVYRLIACLRKDGGRLYNSSRPKMRIYNILDLNIAPINMHALQREIPFINLMNYSHTFDNIVKNVIGVTFKNTPLSDIHGYDPLTNDAVSVWDSKLGEKTYSDEDYVKLFYPEDAMVRHLIYPHGFRRLREYVNYTYKIMAGDTSLGLNRPKFLSDQLWNKVLMNSLYDPRTYGDSKNNFRMRQNESRRQAELKQVSVAYDPKRIYNLLADDLKQMVNVNDNARAAAYNTALADPAATLIINTEINTLFNGENKNYTDLVANLLLMHQRALIAGAAAAANVDFGAVAVNRNNILQYMLGFNEIKDQQLSNEFLKTTVNVAGPATVTLESRLAPGVQKIINSFVVTLRGLGDAVTNPFHSTAAANAAAAIRLPNFDAVVLAIPLNVGVFAVPAPALANAADGVVVRNGFMREIARIMGMRINASNLTLSATANENFSDIQIDVGGALTVVGDDRKEPLILGLLGFVRTNVLNINPLLKNLSYVDKNGVVKDVITSANQHNSGKLQLLALEGYLRYNTRFIRWTEWFVQLQRVTRILMRAQLEWLQDPVVMKHEALSEKVTDYGSNNQGFNLDDFE